MIRCAIFGSLGRMGKLIAGETSGRLDIVGEYDTDPPALQASTPLQAGVQVVIDFSSPAAWTDLDRILKPSSAALVTGTTGLGASEELLLQEWSRQRAVFRAANMSRGIHVLGLLLGKAAAMLGDDFALELVEIHHRWKTDSPSGTALGLRDIWNKTHPGKTVCGREGPVGPRDPSETGVHSLRGGDVPGDHELHLLGDGERLLLAHRATDRRAFAAGAVCAAEWIVSQPAGLYGMNDLMGAPE